jgi:hypothetical protein
MSRLTRPLFDARMIDVVPVLRGMLAPPDTALSPTLLFGSAPNTYRITKSGLKYLAEQGLIELGQIPTPSTGRSGMFISHELFITDIRIAFLRSAATHAGHCLEAWHQGPSATMGLSTPAKPRTLRPDAWACYRLGEQVLIAIFEADRGTERGNRSNRWDEKIAGYQTLFESGRLKEVTGYQNARVLTITLTAARRDWIAEHIAKKASPELVARFWVAERSVLEAADLSIPLWRHAGSSGLVPLLLRDQV